MQSKSTVADAGAGPGVSLRLHIPDKIEDKIFPNIRDLAERLHFSPTDGRIWLDDSRMILLRTEAFGALRQELIESLGVESARGLLTRMGYLAGSKDAALARKVRPGDNQIDMFMVGPQMHGLEGVVRAEPVRLEIDSATGHFYCEVVWKDSSEDESHISIYGLGSEPACWMQTGYASGYSSAFMGKRILFREVECSSTGAAHCRVIGKPVEEWDDPELDMKYLEAQPLQQRRGVAPGSAPQPAFGAPLPAGGGSGGHAVAIGASAGFFGVIHRINRVAGTRATVLLLGESGVGKSMFACEVHSKSPRANKPLIQLNCAAMPEQLMESELFGVDKGAYTGVNESRPGRFEAADGGTIFLDEIACLSLTAQAKLLRVLQSGELEHLGSTRTRKVDVRVVAATNENLKVAVEEGRFRKDLYYRLNVFPILIPPLRERRADIPLLLEKLLRELCQRLGRQVSGVTNRAMQALLTHQWPGNIRELENVLERGIILADEGGAIDIPHLFSVDESPANSTQLGLAELAALTPAMPSLAETTGLGPASGTSIDEWASGVIARQQSTLGQIEDALMQAALKSAHGNISKAASLLGITRAQMDYRTKKLPQPR
ncbi:sigma-54-dependent Fis family transcriptional regulator [Herbaspirillum chlorophenolicum]|uniref:sigma-54-dependent Fis family transcriptional regulator n=1 Tax=Herbaspirillum chlorophenolicum TaxID=211589 RepID=UPI0009E33896|nr:sigma-54-dependent Fis family transcriptional regulator [Herbaspirillum chlorophenolicum]